MAEVRVTMSGDRDGEFVVEEERPDGSLVLVPDAVWEEGQRTARRATEREWQDFLAEHGSHMQPPDGEGLDLPRFGGHASAWHQAASSS